VFGAAATSLNAVAAYILKLTAITIGSSDAGRPVERGLQEALREIMDAAG
jgi:hypothetical protein